MKTNAQTIRLEMQRKGWNSKDSISDMGWGRNEDGSPKYGYSIWFTRWNWHGKRCDERSYRASTNDLNKIEETVRRAAALAQRAWDEFPDQLVSTDCNGELQPECETIQKLFRSASVVELLNQDRYKQVFNFELELVRPHGDWMPRGPITAIEIGLEKFTDCCVNEEDGHFYVAFDREGYHDFTNAVSSAIQDIVVAGFRVKRGRGFNIPNLGMNGYDY